MIDKGTRGTGQEPEGQEVGLALRKEERSNAAEELLQTAEHF